MTRRGLWVFSAGSKQRTQEKVIPFIHFVVAININPPASTQITRIAGTVHCYTGAVRTYSGIKPLEPAMKRQIRCDKGVKVQTLAGYENQCENFKSRFPPHKNKDKLV